MFNIGFGELIIVLLIAFVVVGPADMPKVARAIAKLYKKAQRLWKEILAAVNMESEIEDIKEIKKDVDKVIKEVNSISLTKEVDDVTKLISETKKEAEKQFHK